jgi:hypothetical protein
MKPQPATSLADFGVSKSESSRWQRIASVPPEVRGEYVEETKAAGGEVSTDGLTRHDPAGDTAPPNSARSNPPPRRSTS